MSCHTTLILFQEVKPKAQILSIALEPLLLNKESSFHHHRKSCYSHEIHIPQAGYSFEKFHQNPRHTSVRSLQPAADLFVALCNIVGRIYGVTP